MTLSKYALMQQASIGPLDTLFKYDVLLLLLIIIIRCFLFASDNIDNSNHSLPPFCYLFNFF